MTTRRGLLVIAVLAALGVVRAALDGGADADPASVVQSGARTPAGAETRAAGRTAEARPQPRAESPAEPPAAPPAWDAIARVKREGALGEVRATVDEWRAAGLPAEHPALRAAVAGRLPANVGLALPAGDDFAGGVAPAAQLDGIPHLILDEWRRSLRAELGREPTRDEVLRLIAEDDRRTRALNDQLEARGAELRALHARGDAAGALALERALVERFYSESKR